MGFKYLYFQGMPGSLRGQHKNAIGNRHNDQAILDIGKYLKFWAKRRTAGRSRRVFFFKYCVSLIVIIDIESIEYHQIICIYYYSAAPTLVRFK